MNAFLREDGLDDASGAGAVSAQNQHCMRVSDNSNVRTPVELTHLIHARVIPGLVRAYQSGRGQRRTPQAVGAEHPTGPKRVAEFAQSILCDRLEDTQCKINGYLRDGVPIERIYLDLLMPAARYLGLRWSADSCDFTEVTVGCWRLQQIMREFEEELSARCVQGAAIDSVLLSAVPGEHHTLGVSMLAAFFRRAGYEVLGEPAATATQIIEMVRAWELDVVGLSVATDSALAGLASLVASIRRACSGKSVLILVGGAGIDRQSHSVNAIGADAALSDPMEAIATVKRWRAKRAEAKCAISRSSEERTPAFIGD
ncbi:MAG: cobalamin B12-binding domain-containing protein [Burkholderiaceae bacterium]